MNYGAPPRIHQTLGMGCAIWGLVSPAGDPVSRVPWMGYRCDSPLGPGGRRAEPAGSSWAAPSLLTFCYVYIIFWVFWSEKRPEITALGSWGTSHLFLKKSDNNANITLTARNYYILNIYNVLNYIYKTKLYILYIILYIIYAYYVIYITYTFIYIILLLLLKLTPPYELVTIIPYFTDKETRLREVMRQPQGHPVSSTPVAWTPSLSKAMMLVLFLTGQG